MEQRSRMQRCVEERRVLYEQACEQERLYYERRDSVEKETLCARPRQSRLQTKPHKKYLKRNNWILQSAKYFKRPVA